MMRNFAGFGKKIGHSLAFVSFARKKESKGIRDRRLFSKEKRTEREKERGRGMRDKEEGVDPAPLNAKGLSQLELLLSETLLKQFDSQDFTPLER